MENLTIYHGSELEIKKPEKSEGKKFNDYGQGFYCTKYKDLASQWACKYQEDGIVNKYVIDIDNLNVLYLEGNYNILNWLAILVENREFIGSTALINQKYIIDNYSIDYKHYDIIIGYRADDAYFRFVREFLNNTIGVNTLDKAMYLGKLGLQVFIQSEKAFSKLHFVKSFEVDQEVHYTESMKSVERATRKYEELKIKNEQTDKFIREIKGGDFNENSLPKIKIE